MIESLDFFPRRERMVPTIGSPQLLRHIRQSSDQAFVQETEERDFRRRRALEEANLKRMQKEVPSLNL